MKRHLFIKLTISLCLILNISNLYAGGAYVHVSDMSQIKYQLTSDGNVYFRNLNSFNSAATGCCYAFYLDTTSPYGKSAWSVILMKMASKSPLSLYADEIAPPTSGNPSAISHLGNW